MVPEYLAPGVYIEEIPSNVHPIDGVPTSITAFVGATAKGPAGPALVKSFAEFTAQYGGLADGMPLGHAVAHYFANGGREALIARVETQGGGKLTDADLSNPALEKKQRGLWLLDQAKQFNVLCIPPLGSASDVGRATWNAAAAYAQKRRALQIVDPPAAWTSANAVTAASLAALVTPSANAAVYFPRLRARDPLHGNAVGSFAPCGAVAGVLARIDQARGVWHSPAGAEATLHGFEGADVTLSDAEIGPLAALNVNAIRTQPALVVWGARTLAPDAPEFKYVAVRRLALFIEASLEEGLRWAVLEPPTPALAARVRASIENFLHALWQQRAFQGAKPEEGYFVRCDDTTTQEDIAAGRLNAMVGFAPLKPAEFVVVSLAVVLRKKEP